MALKAMQEAAARDLASADAATAKAKLLRPTQPEQEDPNIAAALAAAAGRSPAPAKPERPVGSTQGANWGLNFADSGIGGPFLPGQNLRKASPDSASVLRRVVKDDPEGETPARAQAAHAVAHRHPIGAARAFDRPVMDREDDGLGLAATARPRP